MDREIKRTVKKLCDEAGSAAAAAACDDLTEDIEKAYNERVKAGMSELDAYRDVLKNVDEIKKMLDSLPITEDEQRGRQNRDSYKDNAKVIDKISSALWLLVVLVYLAFSLRFGGWRYTWLIFLWGSIGQTLMNMVKNTTEEHPRKVLRGGISNMMWLCDCNSVLLYQLRIQRLSYMAHIHIRGVCRKNHRHILWRLNMEG